MRNIYISITTIKDWRPKISEIDQMGIEEAALFPTAIGLNERKELYQALKKSGLKRIPCVHLRSDMERWEIEWLVENYSTEKFNLHPSSESREFIEKNLDLAHKIYIENLDRLSPIFFELAEETGGVCLDVSHYEDFGVLQHSEGYDSFREYLSKHKPGWNHISGINNKTAKNSTSLEGRKIVEYNLHNLDNLQQLDYLQKYPDLISSDVAIELNNSISEQLEAKEYIQKMFF